MASSGSSGHLVEELDAAFQNCLAAVMKQEHFNLTDQDETKNSVEQCIQKFADIAKQLECFFLQKRLLLSVHKPEQILKEDITELKLELQRKDQLLQRHHEKLQHWQNLLSRQSQGQTQTQSQQQQQQQQQQSQQQQQQQQAPQPQPTPQQQQPQQQQQQPQPQPQQQAPTQPSQVPMQMHSQVSVPGQMGPGGMHNIPQRMQHMAQPQQQPQLHQQMSQPGMPGPGMAMNTMGPGAPQNIGMGHPPHQLQHQSSFPAGPLAYLEQTTSNIGMPDRRQ